MAKRTSIRCRARQARDVGELFAEIFDLLHEVVPVAGKSASTRVIPCRVSMR
jgi:hypothetical protein